MDKISLEFSGLSYRAATLDESRTAVALYEEHEIEQNGGVSPQITGARGRQSWLVKRNLNGVDIAVMGPDRDLGSYTPCVAGVDGERIVWMVVLGSSYCGVHLLHGSEDRLGHDLMMVRLNGYG